MFCKTIVRGLLAAVVVVLTAASTNADSVRISGASAFGWPNERASDNIPSLAVDGDIGTFTWTTKAYNTETGHLGLDFGREVSVNRIRLYKDNDGGGAPSNAPTTKNLEILFTTNSTAIPLAGRTFAHVTNLTNGFQGTEAMHATSVNADGTVLGDVHSATDGWASLSFTPVVATGVAISFYYPVSGQPVVYQHYKVYEFEAYMNSVPEPSALLLLGIGAISLLAWRRRRTAQGVLHSA